ncbi:hypothetical protein QQS21_009408 [Conoideocrella luteorostrata]|uniref:DJ-1/PfpI domain-containing protein n=1 Tax=Conoideocrella luteorostrata TaxID=1105319 RepID=A0AAJ0CH12_9HYPO|nr:hypothetical protein QQS21_009408 [Conoideocrella luteorostrata]
MKLNLVSWLVSVGLASAAVIGRDAGNNEDYPKNWAVTLFNSFDTIDVFGPIDVLFYLSMSKHLNLNFVAETMNPMWMRPSSPALNKFGSQFMASINPTHTYSEPPKDIDVLLVPGGLGMRNETITKSAVDFIRKAYPNVKYLLTICTGSGVAAKAGVLDGKRATTNKAAWNETTKMGPEVKWVSPARWTEDGNVWTSSGVTAGLDLIFEFIDKKYSKELSQTLQNRVEYERVKDACADPFAAVHKVPPTGDCRA